MNAVLLMAGGLITAGLALLVLAIVCVVKLSKLDDIQIGGED